MLCWQGVVLVEGAALKRFCEAWATQSCWAFALDYTKLQDVRVAGDPELKLPPLPGSLPSQH